MRTGTKLFLGGLTKTTTTELLYATFAPFGVLLDAVVMERNGCPRGFGFVTFAEELAVKQVLAQTVLVDGREVDIKRAVPEEEMEHVPTKVFVGGLPQKVDRTILKQHFARYGDVRDCVVMMDRTTGRSRGFGFVRFSAPEAVEAVLSAPQVLEGQVVDCKRAQPAEMLPPPKNPRTRGEEKQAFGAEAAPLSEWLQLFAGASAFEQQPCNLFDWSQYGAFDPSLFDPSLFDPSYLAGYASAFDVNAAVFTPGLAACAPTAFEYEAPAQAELPEPVLPAASPLGDVSNRLLGAAKTLKPFGENAAPFVPQKAAPAAFTFGENKNPLGDLSNLLAAASEKRGFSAALKEAMKEEATSAASLAFGH